MPNIEEPPTPSSPSPDVPVPHNRPDNEIAGLTPWTVLQAAVKAVPALKYALGVLGIVSAIAIIKGFGIDFRVAVFGTIIMLVLMTALVVFASLTKVKSRQMRAAALAFMWSFLILTIVSAALFFTSAFFDYPKPLAELVAIGGSSYGTGDPEDPYVPNSPPELTFASGIRDEWYPKDSIDHAYFDDGEFYACLRWANIDLAKPIHIKTEFYDGSSMLVSTVERESTPSQSPGYSWARHRFDESKEQEGVWTVKVFAWSTLVATGRIRIERVRDDGGRRRFRPSKDQPAPLPPMQTICRELHLSGIGEHNCSPTNTLVGPGRVLVGCVGGGTCNIIKGEENEDGKGCFGIPSTQDVVSSQVVSLSPSEVLCPRSGKIDVKVWRTAEQLAVAQRRACYSEGVACR